MFSATTYDCVRLPMQVDTRLSPRLFPVPQRQDTSLPIRQVRFGPNRVRTLQPRAPWLEDSRKIVERKAMAARSLKRGFAHKLASGSKAALLVQEGWRAPASRV